MVVVNFYYQTLINVYIVVFWRVNFYIKRIHILGNATVSIEMV